MNTASLLLPGAVRRSGERGSAMVLAFFAILVVVLACATMLTVAKQELAMNRYLVDRNKARAVANGGMEKTLAWLTQNPTLGQAIPTSVSQGTMGGGSYVVTTSSVSSGVMMLLSTATVDNVTAQTRVCLKWPDSAIALNAAIFSNGNISGNGSYQVNGDVYSNQNINMGGSATVDGDVYAHGTAAVSNTNGHGIHPGSPQISFPKVDTNYYYDIASSHGQVISLADFTKNKTATFSPAGDVLWVNANGGTISMTGNYDITVNGTLVVYNGSVDIRGNANLTVNAKTTSEGTMPAMIVIGGTVSLGGGANIDGCIYANAGTVSMQGTADLDGNVIAWGDVNPGGTPTVTPKAKNDVELDPKDIQLSLLSWLE